MEKKIIEEKTLSLISGRRASQTILACGYNSNIKNANQIQEFYDTRILSFEGAIDMDEIAKDGFNKEDKWQVGNNIPKCKIDWTIMIPLSDKAEKSFKELLNK